MCVRAGATSICAALEAFRRIRSPKKWLRAHREFEWPDTYDPNNLADLTRFYDRYLKNVRNGWEFTPRVRLGVMDAYDYDHTVNRVETSFPIERTQYKKLYLNAADMGVGYEPYAGKQDLKMAKFLRSPPSLRDVGDMVD